MKVFEALRRIAPGLVPGSQVEARARRADEDAPFPHPRPDRSLPAGLEMRTPFPNLQPVAQIPRLPGLVAVDESWLERPLADYIREDACAIPCAADREGYAPGRDYDYWLSGLKDYLAVKRLSRRHALSLDGGRRVLDFGCASGRVLRHFDAHEQGLSLWGCDVNRRHVSWVCAFLGPRIRAFRNPPFPSLPLEDGHFSLVYAFSVFTHIDEWELGWLAELRRVLAPGGLAYLTILSDRTWTSQRPGSAVYDLLSSARSRGSPPITPDLFERAMPERRVAFVWGGAEAGGAVVFHSLEHVREVWGRFLDVLEVVPEGHDYQDVVLLRK